MSVPSGSSRVSTYFNPENRITWLELAPSLQDLFKLLQSQIDHEVLRAKAAELKLDTRINNIWGTQGLPLEDDGEHTLYLVWKFINATNKVYQDSAENFDEDVPVVFTVDRDTSPPFFKGVDLTTLLPQPMLRGYSIGSYRWSDTPEERAEAEEGDPDTYVQAARTQYGLKNGDPGYCSAHARGGWTRRTSIDGDNKNETIYAVYRDAKITTTGCYPDFETYNGFNNVKICEVTDWCIFQFPIKINAIGFASIPNCLSAPLIQVSGTADGSNSSNYFVHPGRETCKLFEWGVINSVQFQWVQYMQLMESSVLDKTKQVVTNFQGIEEYYGIVEGDNMLKGMYQTTAGLNQWALMSDSVMLKFAELFNKTWENETGYDNFAGVAVHCVGIYPSNWIDRVFGIGTQKTYTILLRDFDMNTWYSGKELIEKGRINLHENAIISDKNGPLDPTMSQYKYGYNGVNSKAELTEMTDFLFLSAHHIYSTVYHNGKEWDIEGPMDDGSLFDADENYFKTAEGYHRAADDFFMTLWYDPWTRLTSYDREVGLNDEIFAEGGEDGGLILHPNEDGHPIKTDSSLK